MNEKTVKRSLDGIQRARGEVDDGVNGRTHRDVWVRETDYDALLAENARLRAVMQEKNDALSSAWTERDQLRATLSDQATYGAEQLGKLNQRVRDLEGETFRLRGVVMEKNTALSAAWAEMAVLENKLRPRLTKNEPPTETDAIDGMVLAWSPDERQDFWAEYGWKQVAELDQSSGDVSFKYWMPYPDRPEWPISALSPPSPLKGEES